jgi:AcrR family transcriptional regulator
MARRYEMTGRAAAMQRTREAILDAAVELFAPAWFDEVTLADVARAAGVSQQTVVNHFGSKIGLYLAGVSERFAPALAELRSRAVPGDVASIVRTAVTDYESSGDATFRLVALAGRIPELDQVLDTGRRAHREWVEHVFAPQLRGLRGKQRERTVVLLATSLDVLTWKALRRDQRLGPDATADHLRVLVEGVLGGA